MRPKGQAPPGRGSRQQSPAHAPSQTSSADDVLLHKVAKAVLAQADYTARLQASQTVLFTFKKDTGPHAMVPMMFQCAENWRQLKARTPTAVTRSLKQTLIHGPRIQLRRLARGDAGFGTETGVEHSDNRSSPGRCPSHKTLLQNPNLVSKFAGARNAQLGSTSETATFVLELSMMEPDAAEAMTIFRRWFASGAMLLLSLRLKPARPLRSPLVLEIQAAVGW